MGRARIMFGPCSVRPQPFPTRMVLPSSTRPALMQSRQSSFAARAMDHGGMCKLAGVKGVSTTRSAPYRLVTSRCWGKGDQRLECTACHDPHAPLQTEARGDMTKLVEAAIDAQG